MQTDTQTLDAYIQEWRNLVAWLATGKAREKELREYIASQAFPKEANGCFTAGTQNTTVTAGGSNFRAKLSAKNNYTVLEEMIAPVWAEAQLTTEEATGLIRYKPELGMKAYKALPDAKRAIVDKMLSVKPGSIELEVNPLPQ